MILLNQPELQKHTWIKEAGRRRDLQVIVPLDGKSPENEREVYLTFYRPLNKKKLLVSNSIYLGRV